MYLAMWSGPRNLSTALMRSFGARADATVSDEPLYAHYLASTGLEHPGRAEILASQPTTWQPVVASLTGPIPHGRTLWYQKHMSHHLLDDIGRDWLDHLTHAFLIRRPAEVIASYAKVRSTMSLDDTGLPQQVRLFDEVVARSGSVPAVIDAADVLRDPEGLLGALCRDAGLQFDPAMLAWEPGPRATDGVWARHWYASVESSTGFAPWRPRTPIVPPEHTALLAACEPLYAHLHQHRLTAGQASTLRPPEA